MPLQSTRQTRAETIQVIDYLFNCEAGSYISRVKISKATGVSVDSVTAILNELASHTCVRRDPTSGRYQWIDRRAAASG